MSVEISTVPTGVHLSQPGSGAEQAGLCSSHRTPLFAFVRLDSEMRYRRQTNWMQSLSMLFFTALMIGATVGGTLFRSEDPQAGELITAFAP